MPVKITAFQAENVKRIKAVQLTPAASGLTIVGGNNNQGKTSVLDAIAWALGGERFRPDAAQREGAVAPAHLRVTLSNGVVVERKGKNSALTVTDPTGRRCGQQLLNGFVEELALDLPRFMNATDKEKADILLRIIGIGTELHTRDMEIKSLYDKRTFTGQLAAQKKHYAEELLSYPEAPDTPVSASELIRRQQEILARNGENQRKRQQLASLEAKAKALDERRVQLEQTLAQITQEQTSLTDALYSARKSAEQLRDESTAELEESIRNIEETNRKVRANLEKARAEDEAAQYASEYDRLTGQIAQKRADRMSLLNGADLPLPGLGVEDGALTYNGRRWADMSGSDQLRVATAIVRRLNPECGFVLLDKLEQMDLNTLHEFARWLESEGLQAIATRVSTGSECRIIIEDGLVQDAEPPAPAQVPQPAKNWTKGAF